MIVAVPAPTPVTTPVEESTVAINASEELHTPDSNESVVNVVVNAAHISWIPSKVPAFGALDIVKITGVLVELEQLVVELTDSA